LTGHTDIVNAVKFFQTSTESLIISGSVDKTIKVWKSSAGNLPQYECIATLSDHQNSINSIAVTPGADVFASGSADAIIKIWKISENNGEFSIAALQTITITPRFFPLALAISPLSGAAGSYVLAAAGTKAIIQLYVADGSISGELNFQLQATLAGHEGWIRSLAFTREKNDPSSDLLLASASQDKYIRLWRIHQGKELPSVAAAGSDPKLGAFMPGKSLSNKAHRFRAADLDYSATFEALLLGHEDWIFSTTWRKGGDKLQLLSVSADNSVAIWEPDSTSGVWVSIARLGEISSEKGSSTATGSTGGFWTGLWSPSGETVTCLGRTGSWRLWNYNEQEDRWIPGIGVGGHVQSVTGIAWSKSGDYLLSTSADQTTRLHAEWKRSDKKTWHELSRPQIHGYDLNCVDSLGESQFVSGADEKLLRVFNEPKAVANLLSKLCGISRSDVQNMPDAANMPVLGLSNKAIDAVDDNVELQNGGEDEREAIDPASVVHKSTLDLDHPPLEDHLARHTLWPETEKLYGHGYEISALAASHDGSLVATACKASSIDHAVIRLFDTKDWREIKPALTAHSLTIARLRFSDDDKFLLSVGRDRQWAVFERDSENKERYTMHENNPKGHSRMILDAAWAPAPMEVFATAGRDKQVKIWAKEEGKFTVKSSIPQENPITAIDFLPGIVEGSAHLAIGTETGKVTVHTVDATSLEVKDAFTIEAT
jgi:elongator complex protein 2